ncbi:MAG: S1 RNA-binding domain-containing protein, partial [Ruminococcus sp.]|nr:S1 RNA-binding domain-containing protein [Ruminococcus sp.]
GFLRVRDGKNPLDNTAVHPESYEAAASLLNECGYTLDDVSHGGAEGIADKADSIGVDKISEKLGIGVPTLTDIIGELKKPGRDLRDELPPPLLRSGDVMDIKDLKPGMELVGTVRNIIDFGCFVDIGVHEDGLVHISQICSQYIKHPLEAVKLGQVVKVRVLDVDTKRNRISLTMLTEAEEEERKQQKQNPRPNNNNRKKRENREKKGFDAGAIRNSAFRIKKK